jgi:hypothetical protein
MNAAEIPQFLKSPRQRIIEPRNQIPCYVFDERNVGVVTFPPAIDAAVKAYVQLLDQHAHKQRNSKKKAEKDPDIKHLRNKIQKYVARSQRLSHASVLSTSHIAGDGIGRGAHVSVTEHGLSRWLVKYSHQKHNSDANNVEFLQKNFSFSKCFFLHIFPAPGSCMASIGEKASILEIPTNLFLLFVVQLRYKSAFKEKHLNK